MQYLVIDYYTLAPKIAEPPRLEGLKAAPELNGEVGIALRFVEDPVCIVIVVLAAMLLLSLLF